MEGWVSTLTRGRKRRGSFLSGRPSPENQLHMPEQGLGSCISGDTCSMNMCLTGLPIFPLKISPPPTNTHLSWAKKVMFKTTTGGNIGTPASRGKCPNIFRRPHGHQARSDCPSPFDLPRPSPASLQETKRLPLETETWECVKLGSPKWGTWTLKAS